MEKQKLANFYTPNFKIVEEIKESLNEWEEISMELKGSSGKKIVVNGRKDDKFKMIKVKRNEDYKYLWIDYGNGTREERIITRNNMNE